MAVFVHISLIHSKITKIDAIRINNIWDMIFRLQAQIQHDSSHADGIPLSKAIKSLGEVIGANDPIIFASQQQLDLFRHVVKRYSKFHIGARSYVLPAELSLNSEQDIQSIIADLSHTFSSASSFASFINSKG